MKIINIFFLILILLTSKALSDDRTNFNDWKKNFKTRALSNNISEQTIDTVLTNIVFLPKVIEYDRFQPEFYEDTKTYISKRTSTKKIQRGLEFYKKNIWLISFIKIFKIYNYSKPNNNKT